MLNYAIEIISNSVSTMKKGKLEISIDKLIEIDKSLWSDIIKFSIERNYSIQVSFVDCNKVISLLTNQTGKIVSLSNGLMALRERDMILIYVNRKQKKADYIEIKIGRSGIIDKKEIIINRVDKKIAINSKNKNIEYIDADKVSKTFRLRFWKDGDRFSPLGLIGSKKVSDFLNNQKVSAFEKRNQLVLTNNKKIIWVVGHRIDDRFKITDKTRKVLQLCLK